MLTALGVSLRGEATGPRCSFEWTAGGSVALQDSSLPCNSASASGAPVAAHHGAAFVLRSPVPDPGGLRDDKASVSRDHVLSRPFPCGSAVEACSHGPMSGRHPFLGRLTPVTDVAVTARQLRTNSSLVVPGRDRVFAAHWCWTRRVWVEDRQAYRIGSRKIRHQRLLDTREYACGARAVTPILVVDPALQ